MSHLSKQCEDEMAAGRHAEEVAKRRAETRTQSSKAYPWMANNDEYLTKLDDYSDKQLLIEKIDAAHKACYGSKVADGKSKCLCNLCTLGFYTCYQTPLFKLAAQLYNLCEKHKPTDDSKTGDSVDSNNTSAAATEKTAE